MFKKLLSVLVMVLAVATSTTAVPAATRVSGYYRSTGTYVQPHYRSNPDGNFYNNWTTYPNVNPYTGSYGTRLTPPQPRYDRGTNYPAYPYYNYSY